MFPAEVETVLRCLEAAGYEAYAVGGCVRDLLLGKTPEDYDMTTSARPEQVMALFDGFCIPTGLQHGTVTVRQDGKSFEVTTFRTEGPYEDGRHPSAVYFSQRLEEDLKRRDFTVNAMAMDVEGHITDLFGGQEDLRRGIIRCVGEPKKRFEEDALRILRALRFAATLGFSVEEATGNAIRESRAGLQKIAAERIRVEMTKLLCGQKAGEILLAWPEVLGVFLPEILPCVGFDQCNRYHCYDVWEHTVRAVDAAPCDPIVRWTMLLHDLAKPVVFTKDEQGNGHFYGHAQCSAEIAREILHRLRFDRRSAQRIEQLVLWHDRQIQPTEKSVARALRTMGEEPLGQLFAVKRADNLAQPMELRSRQQEITELEEIVASLLSKEQCFTLRQLAVNGRDLMELGLQGMAIGKMLQDLLSAVVDGALENDRETLLLWVKERIGNNKI